MRQNSEINTDVRAMGIAGSVDELNMLKSRQNVGICSIGIAVILMVLTAISPIFLLFSIAFIVFGIIKLRDTNRSFKLIYKQLFVEEPLRRNFSNVIYHWDKGFTSDAVSQFGLCCMGNRFHSEDYICAGYNGVNFELSQVKVQYHTSSGKSSHTVTYFDGRMMVVDFPEKMVLSVQIFSDNFAYRGRQLTGLRDEKVEMESVNFNKHFDVRAVNPHDAFYLLTPQFMERLELLLKKYHSIAVHVSNGKMFIGMKEPYNDAFDVKRGVKSISYPDEMAKVQGDIDDIKAIISIVKDMQNRPGPVKNDRMQLDQSLKNVNLQNTFMFGGAAMMQRNVMRQNVMPQDIVQQNIMPPDALPQQGDGTTVKDLLKQQMQP